MNKLLMYERLVRQFFLLVCNFLSSYSVDRSMEPESTMEPDVSGPANGQIEEEPDDVSLNSYS